MHRYDSDSGYRNMTLSLGLETGAYHAAFHTPSEARPVYERIEGWMRFLGYPVRDIFAVKIALHEAVANAFRHGNRGERTKQVRVTYLVTPDEALAEVQDEGGGFDPGPPVAPLTRENADRPVARGLFLMRAYTSWLSFNTRGSSVTLCRIRSRS